MARGRSRAEREEHFYSAQIRHWEWFRAALAAAPGYAEALQLAHSGPGPDEPGRKYHSNLAFFLQSFVVPDGSGDTERALYSALVKRMDAAGQLKPGVADRVVGALAMPSRSF